MPNTIPSYRLYREKSGESGDFWIHCETIPERTHLHNWEIAQHRHDGFFQIFYLTVGHGEMAQGSLVRQFTAPCALFIPAGAPHGFRFARDIDGLVVTAIADRLRPLAATDRRIADFVSETRIVPLPDDDVDAVRVCGGIEQLHAELHGRQPGRLALLEPLMTQAVVGLARSIVGRNGASENGGRSSRERLEQLATMIAAHCREHRPVEFYAGALGLSPAHLNRLARAETGHSVHGLIALQLVEAARRDLVFTPTSIQAIAYSLGFSDPAYFNRFFRRQTGMTPGAFREAERRRLAA